MTTVATRAVVLKTKLSSTSWAILSMSMADMSLADIAHECGFDVARHLRAWLVSEPTTADLTLMKLLAFLHSSLESGKCLSEIWFVRPSRTGNFSEQSRDAGMDCRLIVWIRVWRSVISVPAIGATGEEEGVVLADRCHTEIA